MTIEPNLVVFDLETQHSLQEVGGRQHLHLLRVSVAVTYDTTRDRCTEYLEEDIPDLVEALLAADLVVGYNLLGFDYPVLAAYTDAPLANLPTVDMLRRLYDRLGFRVSLDNVAGATLGTQKSADGLQAIRWFRQGNMTDLLAYCRQDVIVTYQLYTFGHENGYVAYVDRFHRQHRVRVDW